jgi:hypothetical protein
MLYGALALAVGLLSWGSEVRAQISSISISVDESGNGSLVGFLGAQTLPASQTQDPGPGGLANALTYGLINPPGLVAGDLILAEPGSANGALSDLIRFNPNQNGGSLVFYSDLELPRNALADIGFPTSLYTNVLTLSEAGPETGPNGIVYTPTAGQPGFVAGAAVPVTYTINSDPAPEPSSLALLTIAGLTCGAVALARRRKRASA